MRLTRTPRGYELGEWADASGKACELRQSDAIEVDAPGRGQPGTTFVWLGRKPHRMHLDRTQVVELVNRLGAWLKNGSFLFTGEPPLEMKEQ
jgi:hypothetical protein